MKEGELERLFPGDSELAGRMRALDWSKSDLGPPESWPDNLRIAVSLCLNSRYPLFVWWGCRLTNFYNDAYAPMLGKRHPDALGRPAAEVWSDVWPVVGPQTEAVLNEGRATWNEEKLLVMERNGFTEEAYFTFSYSPLPDDDGSVGGVFCAVTEDTGRILSQRRLRTLRLVAEQASKAKTGEEACEVAAATLAENPNDLPFALLYLLDVRGRQATLAGSMGVKRNTSASPAVVELENASATWPFRQVMESGISANVEDLPEKLGPLPGGAWPESPQRAVVLPMMKPGQTQLAGFIVAGISPRLAFNDDYRAFMDLLAGHVASAVANARAYEEERRRAEALVELDRAKTVFFSNVSHEFRTPLTLMLGPVEDLLARSYTDLSPAAKSELEVVNRNGLRLLRLVNTLLDFSRIEAGRVQAVFEPTDLAAFTGELASVFRSACERAGLKLVVDSPKLSEPVFVDRDMWEKIVLNLISNAFKFTFEGEIAVTLRQMLPRSPPLKGGERGGVELRVRDTGTGIPAEEIPRLFERFHRVHSVQGRTHEGSGIGLALVQELVKLHGGSVQVESTFGAGSTFIVTVPLGTAHLSPDRIGGSRTLASTATGARPFVEEALRWLPADDQAGDDFSGAFALPEESLPIPCSQPEEEGSDRPRVLVADDNADMRHYLVRLLAERYTVEAAADGEAALTVARERPPDLILSDVMMPRLDGFGLLRELRADPRTANLPVIMLSARAGEENRVEGMEAGADDYLVKPFSARELLARVGAHLQIARLRREAEVAVRASEVRYRRLFEAAKDGILILDTDNGKIIDANSFMSELLGYSHDEFLGKELWEIGLFRNIEASRAAYRELRQQGQIRYDHLPLKTKGGKSVDVEFISNVYREDHQAVMQCNIRDITERKRLEKELQQYAADLSEADRRKNEFLAMLAHELRNPLAPIRNALQILRLTGGNGEAVQSASEMLERQVGQMVRLVDDLLDVNRISRGKIELRKGRVELASVVNHAVEATRPQCASKGLELTVTLPQEPPYVNGDPTRLAQVVSNLLNNACKFTERGGRIGLTVEREGEQGVIRVRDTGIGIAADQLTRIFDMFTQIDTSLERSQTGLGIGLTLVKSLVEMHGGTVKAHSDGLGYGSEFVVRLPILTETAKPLQPEPTVSKPTPTTARRILIVDDNRDSAASLAMLLELTGNQTHTAYDGREAVEAAEKFRPDVILLDIGLPELNGYEAARKIREHQWGKTMVLVALTGWGQEEDRRKSKDAGFDAHLVKPVDYAALMKLLAESGAG